MSNRKQQNQFVKETTDFNQVSTNRPTLYSCQWENCFKRLNNNTFLNHVIEDHLEKRGNRQIREFQLSM